MLERDGGNLTFWMLSNSLLPSSTAVTIEAKLSSVRTMSAASLATSLPFMPMAMPTSDFLSAGESLTPSPVMTQNARRRCMASTMRTFVDGLHLASTSGSLSMASTCALLRASNALACMMACGSMGAPAAAGGRMPTSRAMAVAVLTWSPVSMCTVMPARWHLSTAGALSTRGGSYRPTRPTKSRPASAVSRFDRSNAVATRLATHSTRSPSAASVSAMAEISRCLAPVIWRSGRIASTAPLVYAVRRPLSASPVS